MAGVKSSGQQAEAGIALRNSAQRPSPSFSLVEQVGGYNQPEMVMVLLDRLGQRNWKIHGGNSEACATPGTEV